MHYKKVVSLADLKKSKYNKYGLTQKQIDEILENKKRQQELINAKDDSYELPFTQNDIDDFWKKLT